MHCFPRFSKPSVCYITNHLVTVHSVNQLILFPLNLNVSLGEDYRETQLTFSGPRDQSISVYYCFGFQVAVEAGVNIPVSIIPQLKAKLKGHVKKKTVPPKAATRNTRGPVYFKCVCVDYDKENGRLKLPKGEFLGKTTHRAVGEEEDKEYSETTLSFENEENDLTGSTHAYSYPIPGFSCSFSSGLEFLKHGKSFQGKLLVHGGMD